MSINLLERCFLAIILLVAAGHAAARDAFEGLLNMSLDDLLNVPITVASLHNESNINAPSSVTSFTRRQIENLGVNTVEELLNFVPGFQSSRETFLNQGYRVGARGLLTPQPSYSVLFLIDGQRMNSDLSAGALFANRFITTANVERVEIIRGPGSALYGTSAFSGVVNIITTKDANNLYAGAGNLGSQEVYGNGAAEGSINGTRWRASGFLRSYGDNGQRYDESETAPVNPAVSSTRDPYSARDAYVSLGWGNRVALNLRHSERKLDDFFDFMYVRDGVSRAETHQTSASLSLQIIEPAETRSLEFRSGISQAAEQQVEELGVDLGTYQYQVTEWDFALNGFYVLNDHELRAGLTYREPDVDSYQFNKDDGSGHITLGATDSRAISGAYLQDQFDITGQWRGTLGVRFDRYSDVGSNSSPRLALIYNLDNLTGFKILYGEAFRAPNRFQTSDLYLGNADVVSEEIKTYELAWLQDHRRWLPDNMDLQTTATWFVSRHENRIALTNRTDSSGLQTTNSDEVQQTSGLELEMAVAYGPSGTFHVTYTYLPETQEAPQSFPRHLFSLISNVELGKWNLNLSAVYRGSTQQPLLGAEFAELDSYWLANANVRYLLDSGVHVIARIENLADTTYYSPTEIRLMNHGLINRGRTYSLGIELNF